MRTATYVRDTRCTNSESCTKTIRNNHGNCHEVLSAIPVRHISHKNITRYKLTTVIDCPRRRESYAAEGDSDGALSSEVARYVNLYSKTLPYSKFLRQLFDKSGNYFSRTRPIRISMLSESMALQETVLSPVISRWCSSRGFWVSLAVSLDSDGSAGNTPEN